MACAWSRWRWNMRMACVPPLVGALLKNEQDISLFENLVFMNQRNR